MNRGRTPQHVAVIGSGFAGLAAALRLAQAGARPESLRLAEAGLRGNGHMMMLEKNSDQVADALVAWIAGRVR